MRKSSNSMTIKSAAKFMISSTTSGVVSIPSSSNLTEKIYQRAVPKQQYERASLRMLAYLLKQPTFLAYTKSFVLRMLVCSASNKYAKNTVSPNLRVMNAPLGLISFAKTSLPRFQIITTYIRRDNTTVDTDFK